MMENYQIDINKENKKTDDIYNIANEILKNAHRIAKVQTSSKDSSSCWPLFNFVCILSIISLMIVFFILLPSIV